MSNSLWPRLYPTRLPSPWNSPGKNTGVGSHSLLQRIFPTQGLNPVLPHCRQILQHLSHQGSPSNLIGHPIFLFAKPDHPGQTPLSAAWLTSLHLEGVSADFSASLSTFSRARPPGVIEQPAPAASLAAHGKGSQLQAWVSGASWHFRLGSPSKKAVGCSE